MKRRVNRRALSVYLGILILYVCIVFDLPRKIAVERLTTEEKISLQNIMGQDTTTMNEVEKLDVWPIFYAFVNYSIESGELDEDCLILVRKGDSLEFKRPYEILKERNREGLESLLRLIGKSKFIAFLKREGITLEGAERIEDILIQLHTLREKEELKGLIRKGMKEGTRSESFSKTQSEWVMPDLRNLPLREAISKLSPYTSKIKVVGYGEVEDQEPKPEKRIFGEVECILYGNQR